MKKFFVAIMLSVAVVMQAAAAHAEDYYVGTSPATGMDCYLMTHTITELKHYSDGGRFSARLKMVDKKIRYLDYELDIGTSGCMFRNSAGYSGAATAHGTPIEWNMCQYIAANYLRR